VTQGNQSNLFTKIKNKKFVCKILLSGFLWKIYTELSSKLLQVEIQEVHDL